MTVYVKSDYFDYMTYPLNHARIGWGFGHRDATWSASGEATDYEAESLRSAMTARRWRATSNSATVTASQSDTLDWVGIAAHNLDGATVTVSVGGTTVGSETASEGETMLFLFAPRSGNVQVSITHSTPPEIGVIMFGQALEMQRPFFGGHSPASLSGVVTRFPRRSESGQFLSRAIVRRGYESSVDWDNLGGDWYRDNFQPFAEYAKESNPFFVSWNALEYPEDVVYAWTDDDIQPSYSGTRDWMQVGFNIKGYRGRE